MDWQQIETAPKDGTQFIALRHLNEPPWTSMSVAAWDNEADGWLCNMTHFAPEDFERVWTHWHELPAPPKPS